MLFRPLLQDRSTVWVLCGLLVAAGCSRRNENLATVTGTVLLDGKPLPDAVVVFAPISSGTTSYGKTDENGQYEMWFNDREKGSWIGENQVKITTFDVGAGGGPGTREKVPANYNLRTELTANVQPGENTFDFKLESDSGRVIQPALE